MRKLKCKRNPVCLVCYITLSNIGISYIYFINLYCNQVTVRKYSTRKVISLVDLTNFGVSETEKRLKKFTASLSLAYLFVQLFLFAEITRHSVEHCTCTTMAPGYISLAYLIDFRMIKLYRLPMLAKCGKAAFHFSI